MDFRVTFPKVMNMGNQVLADKSAHAKELLDPPTVLPKVDGKCLLVVTRGMRTDSAGVPLDERGLQFWHRKGIRGRRRYFLVDASWARARVRAPRPGHEAREVEVSG